MFCDGRPSVEVSCRCGSWVDQGFRFVSSRFVSVMLLAVVYGRYGVRAVIQQCPTARLMCGGVAVRSTIPGPGRENTGDANAGRAGRGDNRWAQYAGSTWRTQHAAQIAGRRYRRSRRAGTAGGNKGWAEVVVVAVEVVTTVAEPCWSEPV